jgi:hypothetical protein
MRCPTPADQLNILVRFSQISQTRRCSRNYLQSGIVLLLVCACGFGQTLIPADCLRPKAAFTISAPAGWVLTIALGLSRACPCALPEIPHGRMLERSCAKIASTQFTDGSVRHRGDHGNTKTHGRQSKDRVGKTSDGRLLHSNEYPATKSYSQWERVACSITRRGCVCRIVEQDEPGIADSSALREVLKSLAYMKVENDQENVNRSA